MKKNACIDPHGYNILDLDGDGILDMYIAQGGSEGKPVDKPAMLYNMLLFGELDENGNTAFRGKFFSSKTGHFQNRRGR